MLALRGTLASFGRETGDAANTARVAGSRPSGAGANASTDAANSNTDTEIELRMEVMGR